MIRWLLCWLGWHRPPGIPSEDGKTYCLSCGREVKGR